MKDQLMQLLHARSGHFELESGHHGELWLDLELLHLQPTRTQPLAVELARRLRDYPIDGVCGPLVEGAFVGLMVAQELDVEFFYTEPAKVPDREGLFPVSYHLPAGLRQRIKGKRLAIVNDVINAGSAVRGTYFDIDSSGASVLAMATLLTLGDSAKALADEWNIDLISIASQSNRIWPPEECPMCAEAVPLENA